MKGLSCFAVRIRRNQQMHVRTMKEAFGRSEHFGPTLKNRHLTTKLIHRPRKPRSGKRLASEPAHWFWEQRPKQGLVKSRTKIAPTVSWWHRQPLQRAKQPPLSVRNPTKTAPRWAGDRVLRAERPVAAVKRAVPETKQHAAAGQIAPDGLWITPAAGPGEHHGSTFGEAPAWEEPCAGTTAKVRRY